MSISPNSPRAASCFSALQRAEIAEINPRASAKSLSLSFSALQRAEIAEIDQRAVAEQTRNAVSVLFNEPKLLKFARLVGKLTDAEEVSVLFNEPKLLKSCPAQ